MGARCVGRIDQDEAGDWDDGGRPVSVWRRGGLTTKTPRAQRGAVSSKDARRPSRLADGALCGSGHPLPPSKREQREPEPDHPEPDEPEAPRGPPEPPQTFWGVHVPERAPAVDRAAPASAPFAAPLPSASAYGRGRRPKAPPARLTGRDEYVPRGRLADDEYVRVRVGKRRGGMRARERARRTRGWRTETRESARTK